MLMAEKDEERGSDEEEASDEEEDEEDGTGNFESYASVMLGLHATNIYERKSRQVANLKQKPCTCDDKNQTILQLALGCPSFSRPPINAR
jgi:hypothetical protein